MVAFLNNLDSFLWGTPFIVFVMVIGIYFTLRGKLFPFAHFGHIMKQTLGSLTSKEANAKETGKVSPFEAVCIAIGGCVGNGNIGGVATAIAVGGPGASFWMVLWALFAMMVKMVETALSCYYRSKDEKGTYSSGPMTYIEKGIGRERGIKAGYGLAIAFCIAFAVQMLQGSQAYTIAEVLNSVFGVNMIVIAVLYTAMVYVFTWKGTPRIARVATRLVPFMCIAFIAGGLGLIIANIQNVPSMFGEIFRTAFTGRAATGGFVGATVAQAMSSGISRSVNSNEAGLGNSAMIHGSADTIHPIRQGIWGAFEVFVDTVIICSITALAVLCTGTWTSGVKGGALTVMAYESLYGSIGNYFIAFMMILFGITTTNAALHYYVTCFRYIFRKNPVARDRATFWVKLLFPMINVIVVAYISLSGSGPELFWTIVSIVIIPSIFVNLISMFMLRKPFFRLLDDYKARHMGIGQVDPNFHVFYEDAPEVFREEEAVREELREIQRRHDATVKAKVNV